jgi:DNA invertase Pin-like site-specific DNA recombinase
VAYYRVRSGPRSSRDDALAVQRDAFKGFVGPDDKLVDEFVEDEGSHQRRRPHFEAAIKSAKRHDATLVIPRFRRIHRTATFVEQLRDADIDFVALDMPGANRESIASIVVAARQHRRLVSERIRASLQAAGTRGRRLGNPEIARAQPIAVQAARASAQEVRQALLIKVREMTAEGRSLRAIAGELNRAGIPSARGREWHASSVRTILTEAQAHRRER